MANINLLPWREEQRQERNKVTLVICVAMWAVAGLVVLLGKLYMDSLIDHHYARNVFLQKEINSLSKTIKEIEDIKQRRDALRALMDVIQALQQNRAQIVHVFDDLVKKIPDGVYYDDINKAGTRISINGKAQSNNRVSLLMRGLDASDWFDGASLKVVDVLDQNGESVSEFELEVSEQRQGDNEGDDGIESIR